MHVKSMSETIKDVRLINIYRCPLGESEWDVMVHVWLAPKVGGLGLIG